MKVDVLSVAKKKTALQTTIILPNKNIAIKIFCSIIFCDVISVNTSWICTYCANEIRICNYFEFYCKFLLFIYVD